MKKILEEEEEEVEEEEEEETFYKGKKKKKKLIHSILLLSFLPLKGEKNIRFLYHNKHASKIPSFECIDLSYFIYVCL